MDTVAKYRFALMPSIPGSSQSGIQKFRSSIELLQYHFHDPTSSTLFIPFVETGEATLPEPQTEILEGEFGWIGVVHVCAPYKFLMEALKRLGNCKGLFTTTSVMVEPLQKHLAANGYCIPVQQFPEMQADDPTEFLNRFRKSAVVLSSGAGDSTKLEFDVTISICSYNRTHHLRRILHCLWTEQDYPGKFQIIVWNNNVDRTEVVQGICQEYLQDSHTASRSSLELIHSTQNHFCITRLALAHLMRSRILLVCDDDIIPTSSFISFFMKAHARAPGDVLCTRGFRFRQHELDTESPAGVWENNEHVDFVRDEEPEQFIHVLHGDAFLMTKEALVRCAGVEMPDASFALVDDYWYGFVLDWKFGVKVRKLCTGSSGSGLEELQLELPFDRQPDSESSGAMHCRADVKDAKVRLYIHHMLRGWPELGLSSGQCKLGNRTAWPSCNLNV